MTNPDIQQAKEWAESRAYGNYALSEETLAAVKVIQSLPSQWLDAEELREQIEKADEGRIDAGSFLRKMKELLLALPRPEDVSSGEPWLVEFDGDEWVGVRSPDHSEKVPWAIIRMDGLNYGYVADFDITLVSRLVPEVPDV